MSTNVSTSMVLRAVSDLPQQELSFDNSDVRIHYRRYGSGGAIIFVHGFPDTSLTYHHQILEFAKDHTVFVLALRGFPPSSVPLSPEGYSIPEVVGDIVALFHHLDFDKAHVVGHDLGRRNPSSIRPFPP